MKKIDSLLQEQPPAPVLLRGRRSRIGMDADQDFVMQKLIRDEGLLQPMEIALRAVNEAQEDLETVYQTYGIDSEQYTTARRNLDQALKTVLPYSAYKKEKVIVEQIEVVSIEDTDKRIAELLRKASQ